MGREVIALCDRGYRGASVTAGIDRTQCDTAEITVFGGVGEVSGDFDCIIDFSHHTAAGEICAFAVSEGLPIVVATTGHTEEEQQIIRDAAERVPVFYAANMSLGVALLCELAKKVAMAMPDADIEIVEKHHTRKLDAPSGTALTLAKEICEVRPEAFITTGRSGRSQRDKNEIGIQSIRLGNIVGEHEVIIGTGAETITLKHEAHSRALFAEGAIAAAEFIIGKPEGLYGMKDIIGADRKNMAVM